MYGCDEPRVRDDMTHVVTESSWSTTPMDCRASAVTRYEPEGGAVYVFGIRMAIFKAQFARAWPKTRLRPECLFDMKKVTPSDWSYGPLDVREFANPVEYLTIGRFVSISADVCFCSAACMTCALFRHFPGGLLTLLNGFFLPDQGSDHR